VERRRRDKHINVRPIEKVYLGGVILALTVISWPYDSPGLALSQWETAEWNFNPLENDFLPASAAARSPTSPHVWPFTFFGVGKEGKGVDPGAMSDRILQEPARRVADGLARFVLLLMSRLIVVAYAEGNTACPDDGISRLNANR